MRIVALLGPTQIEGGDCGHYREGLGEGESQGLWESQLPSSFHGDSGTWEGKAPLHLQIKTAFKGEGSVTSPGCS